MAFPPLTPITQFRVQLAAGELQMKRGEGEWETICSTAQFTGPPGADGADGVDGADGADGAQGQQGIQGEQGAPGPNPVQYAQSVVTDAAGAFSVAFPQGMFSAPPVVQCVVVAPGLRDHAVTLDGPPTTSGFSGRVRRSRPLPAVLALLTALQNFDAWEAPGVVGVQVHALGPVL